MEGTTCLATKAIHNQLPATTQHAAIPSFVYLRVGQPNKLQKISGSMSNAARRNTNDTARGGALAKVATREVIDSGTNVMRYHGRMESTKIARDRRAVKNRRSKEHDAQ